MKMTLFILFVFCATSAFSQNASTGALLSNEPVIVEFASHAGHASQQPMGIEQNLLGRSGFTSARGERPLWEFATPLAGDTAWRFSTHVEEGPRNGEKSRHRLA